MKALFIAAALILSAGVSHASNDGGYGIPEVLAQGGLQTVIGGCADATQTGGENSTIDYTGPCHYQGGRPSHPGYTMTCASVELQRRFASEEAATNYCGRLANNQYLSIGTTYDWGYQQWTCSCYDRMQSN